MLRKILHSAIMVIGFRVLKKECYNFTITNLLYWSVERCINVLVILKN